MAWMIKVIYKDGGQVTIKNGRKHCNTAYYQKYWARRDRVASAVLQYCPKKDYEPIDLLKPKEICQATGIECCHCQPGPCGNRGVAE